MCILIIKTVFYGDKDVTKLAALFF